MQTITQTVQLPTANIDLLTKVLIGIVEGNLQYDPRHWHYKDSHNIGGWTQLLAYEEIGYTYLSDKEAYFKDNSLKNPYDNYIYNETKQLLGLTQEETNIVCSPYVSLDIQLMLLGLLKHKIRILGIYKDIRNKDTQRYKLAYILEDKVFYSHDYNTLVDMVPGLYNRFISGEATHN